jgi:hypothetical protein
MKYLLILVLAASCSHNKDLKKVTYYGGASNCPFTFQYMDESGNKQTLSKQDSFSIDVMTDADEYYLKLTKNCPSLSYARVMIDGKLVKEDYCSVGSCSIELKP